MLRAAIERLSRGVVLKRRLDDEFGGLSLYVSPDASLKYWKSNLGQTDSGLLQAARSLVRPGDVVWDVGANVGLFSFAAAGLAGKPGRVLAIEPDPWLAGLLRKSVDLNATHACPVDVLQVAAGSRMELTTLNIARRGRATNYVSGYAPSTQAGGVRDAVTVVSVTLDWLLDCRQAPSIVKIDVEGAEAAVLRGAARLLADVRPRIMCEVSSANRDEATGLLKAAEYDLYDAGRAFPQSGQIAQCAWNTIALPRERAAG